MTPSFKTKLLAVAFVPALVLVAGAASATGNQATSPSSASKATAPTTSSSSSSMQNSMKSGTASADATFDRLDKNHDGKLTSIEAASDSKVQGMWKKLDTDNNGTVTKSEFEAHASDIK